MPDVRAVGAVAPLPDGVRRGLDELTARLGELLGGDLVSVVVYGRILRGEYRPGESSTDVVVVVTDADLTRLEAMTDALQQARYTARIETMVLTERELAGAADAFPLFFDELADRRLVVAGRDPFDGVVVREQDRRLAVERALRQARIRLRRAIVDAAAAPEAVGGAVARRLHELRAPLLGLLRAKGIASESDLASVVRHVGQAYGVDVSALSAPRDTPSEAHEALVALLTHAIDDVDAMAGRPSVR